VATPLHAKGQRFVDSEGESLSQRSKVALLAATLALTISGPVFLRAQQSQNEALVRRAKTKVQPVYPALARKMNIVGTVKVEVVVEPNGLVKEAHVVGGHPVLANAALDAAKKWRFEPSSAESSGVIDFKFDAR
jgi:TonB family protein